MAVKGPDELMDLCERVNQLGCDGSITEGEMKRLMDDLMTVHNFFKEEDDDYADTEEEYYLENERRTEEVQDVSHTYILDMLYDTETLSRDEVLAGFDSVGSHIGEEAWMEEFGHKVQCPSHIWDNSDLSQEVVEEIYKCVIWNIFECGRDDNRREEHCDEVLGTLFELKKSERQAWVDEPGMIHRSMSAFEYVDERFADNCEEDFDEAYEVYVEDRQEWMDEPGCPWREDFDWEWVDRMWGMGCGTTVRGEPVISSVRCRAVDKMWNEAIRESIII